MLSYVNSYRPKFENPDSFQIADRIKSAGIAVPQLVAGVADIALGILCVVPYVAEMGYRAARGLQGDSLLEKPVDNLFPAVKMTLPMVVESAIRTLNPKGFEQELDENNIEGYFYRKVSLLAFAKDLNKVMRKVNGTPHTNSFIEKQIYSRLVVVASMVTSTAAVVLDKLSAPFLVAGSLLTLGRVKALNEYARSSLNLQDPLKLVLQHLFCIFDPSEV